MHFSRKALRKQARILDSGSCVFCGTTEGAITEDHYPPKSWFRQKRWPPGYSYRACQPCNKVSAEADRFVGFLIGASEKLTEESLKLWKGFQANHDRSPQDFLKLAPTPPELRTTNTADKMVVIEGRSWDYLSLVAEKLVRSLVFREKLTIVPRDAQILWLVATNSAQKLELPEQLRELFGPGEGAAASHIGNQFQHWHADIAPGLFGVYCKFRESLAFAFVVSTAATDIYAMHHAGSTGLYRLKPGQMPWQSASS